MDGIKETALYLCSGCVICSVITLITPKGGGTKLIRLALGVFLAAAVGKCAFQAAKSIDIGKIPTGSQEAFEVNNDAVEDFISSVVKRQISEHISSVLASLDVSAEEIIIEMDISEDRCISIGQVTVLVDESLFSKKEMIADEIFKKTNVKANICTEGKNGKAENAPQ